MHQRWTLAELTGRQEPGGSLSKMTRGFAVYRQEKIVVRDGIYCWLDDLPTLRSASNAYGEPFIKIWLAGMFTDLADYCGARTKFNENQLKQLVGIFFSKWHWVNMAELHLFCFRMKTGRYGEFYGTIDPMKITKAMDKFLEERAVMKEKMRKISEAQRILTEAKASPNMSREEYWKRNPGAKEAVEKSIAEALAKKEASV